MSAEEPGLNWRAAAFSSRSQAPAVPADGGLQVPSPNRRGTTGIARQVPLTEPYDVEPGDGLIQTLRSDPDVISDNNLDSLRTCRFPDP